MDYQIEERELAPVLALAHHTTVTMETIPDGIGRAFSVLAEHADETGAQWVGTPFVLYPETCEGEFEMVACIPVAQGAQGSENVGLVEVPGGLVASTVHVGPYSALHNAYVALQKWMTDNGRRPAGMVREVYRNDPEAVPPEELQTEIDWPIA